ncbi:MAG: histidine triad nucleotide-binding protein [Sphaerobacter sp.]|nr:histidine triad nucleotide-binding protein [Sphaerobacter sp.]
MSSDCIFCRIVAGEIPATIVYQDDQVTAFKDIQPQATVHILVIPNQHVASLNEADRLDPALLGRVLQAAATVAREAGIAESGYRLVTNTGPDSGQTVHHLHFHVLGGNPLRLPLG